MRDLISKIKERPSVLLINSFDKQMKAMAAFSLHAVSLTPLLGSRVTLEMRWIRVKSEDRGCGHTA